MKSDGCRRWWQRGGGPDLEEIPHRWRQLVQAFRTPTGRKCTFIVDQRTCPPSWLRRSLQRHQPSPMLDVGVGRRRCQWRCQPMWRSFLVSIEWGSARPSGRFPSVRDSSGGSRTDGVLALVSARYMKSLSSWCRIYRPAPRLHERPCVPSTCLPQRHWCGSQRLVPRRRPTATRTASMSSLNPHVIIIIIIIIIIILFLIFVFCPWAQSQELEY